MLTILSYLLVGALAGGLAGLLGIGGGLIVVPALAWLLPAPETVAVHAAVGTSLATIVFTSLASIRAHHRRGAVRWATAGRLAPGILAGAGAGALVADRLSGPALQSVVGGFAILAGARLLTGRQPAPHRSVPGNAALGTAGAVIGLVSAIVGIGGGSLTAPYLMWHNVRAQQAVATAAACGFPIAVAGTVGFVVTGWSAADMPGASLGYIYLPALAGIAAVSVLTAPVGARLAHRLPTSVLRQVFGGFLVLVGAALIATL